MTHYFRIGVFCGFLALLIQGFVAEGIFPPYRVGSASMSPVLCGPQVCLTCPECRFRFRVNEVPDAAEMPEFAVCPRCGLAEVPASRAVGTGGERIFALKTSRLKRFDLVLFRHPADPAQKAVKRIVGLPGETVSLENGHLRINGKLCPKPLAVQLQTRIPLEYGHWESQDGWLVFVPERPVAHTKNLFRKDAAEIPLRSGVTNERSDNQWMPSLAENTRPVDNLMVDFDCTGAVKLHVFDNGPFTFPAAATSHRKLILSTFDDTLLLAVDGKVLVNEPIFPPWSGRSPFRIHGEKIRNLTVYRDLYYTGLPDTDTAVNPPAAVTVPAGCYYVLGDNSRFSEDSRVWEIPFLPRHHVIGKVISHKAFFLGNALP
ncbi:MAG: signal peptidase I [Planctomycetaceae bacterium]|nr:signal peptidase I [Planctomycetaceae bacterium]